MMPGPKKGARYKRAADRVSAVRRPLTFSKSQDLLIRRAAKRAGMPVNRWAREVLVKEAGFRVKAN